MKQGANERRIVLSFCQNRGLYMLYVCKMLYTLRVKKTVLGFFFLIFSILIFVLVGYSFVLLEKET